MRAEDSVLQGEQRVELNFPGAPSADFTVSTTDGLYVVGEVVVDTVDWAAIPAESIGAGDTLREFIIEYLGPAAAVGGSLAIGAGAASDLRYLYAPAVDLEIARQDALGHLVRTFFQGSAARAALALLRKSDLSLEESDLATLQRMIEDAEETK